LTGITTHYYEKLFNAYCSAEKSRRFFDTRVADNGIETVREARESGRGVLLVTGHYGGVEFMPGYLGFRGLPVSIVVRFASDRLRRLSRSKGGRFGIEIIDADASPSVFFSICRHLKQNRVVITQCDEIDAWRKNGASSLFFLGRRVAPERALSLLVRRTRCPVVFAAMHRNPDLSYRFLAARSEAIEPGGRRGADETGLKFIESLVRRHPHQWYQWVKLPVAEKHRAFRPRPLWSAQQPFHPTAAEESA
jgi:lauroyl/myristoyl acyltransferase